MGRFLGDFSKGGADGRYVAAALPRLPFRDDSFDLALCSHLLFLYSDHLSRDAHVAAVREMLRVAREVRIFPLVTLSGERSRHLATVLAELDLSGIRVTEQAVEYEFQRGANTMLVLSRG